MLAHRGTSSRSVSAASVILQAGNGYVPRQSLVAPDTKEGAGPAGRVALAWLRSGGRVIKDLSERLRTRMGSGDPAVMLDAETLSLARNLGETLARDYREVPPADFVAALSVLVAAHWARYQLLPEGQDQSDWQACLQWSAALLPIAPQLVPQPVRAHLANSGPSAGDAAAEATARADARYNDYQRTGNIQLLQAAITLYQEAVAATPAGHPGRPAMLVSLGRALQARFGRTGQLADLDQLIAVGRELVAALPAGHPARAGRLSSLGSALQIRFGHSGEPADLDQAITLYQEAVAATPAGQRDPETLSLLGTVLRTRFERAGQAADLDGAISAFREAAGTAPAGHPSRPGYLVDLGDVLWSRFERTGQQADLDQAIAVGQEAADGIPAGDPSRPGSLSNFGNALWARFGRTGQQADLDQAIALFREAVAGAEPGHPDRPVRLSNLVNGLWTRFGRTGQAADLDEAITVGQEAIAAVPAGHRARPAVLLNLANARQARYGQTGQPADLEQAITLFREAAAAAPAGHLYRSRALSNLGNALRARFGRTGQAADLDEAITVGQEAIAAASADHPDWLPLLSNLGNARQARYGQTGQPADLDQAIDLFQETVDAAPDSHPARPGYLVNLGDALRIRFGRTGQQADLDQAIAADREAVAATPADHPSRPGYLSTLGGALQTRFGRTGQLADLEEAITLFREAADATPAGRPTRPGFVSNLGAALQARFERAGELADLDQAITLFQEAADAAPAGQPARAAMLSNLGAALRTRFERTGQPADLDQAIAANREAAGATPVSHPSRAGRLSNLGNALHARFERTGQPADLDDAIAVHREAVAAIPAGHPDRPGRLSSLGSALLTRFGRTGQPADLDQALEAFREGAGILTASPEQRAAAAQRWGQCALLAGNPGSAVEGYTTAVELLPVMAWHGLDQPTREHYLRAWAGLASDAAAAAVAAGHQAQAVELLETGRSVLWTDASHLRQDLAALRDRAPDLAAVLEASRAVLNKPFTAPLHDPEADGGVDRVQRAEQQMLEERRQAARDWDAAVDQVRQIEGFEHFLRPVPFGELRAAASGGPVVIVNISEHSSHALIVTPATGPAPDAGAVVVDLPAAPMDTVIGQASALIGALSRAGDSTVDWLTKEDGRHAVFDVLAWCWQAIAEPVLTALGHTDNPAERIEEWPRVWWSPTGPAAVLPLHAAGRHPRTTTQYRVMGEAAALADSVAGRVISSYTPTVAALTRARARPAPGRVRQLAVGVPEAPAYDPGASSLPAVCDELETVAAYLPAPEHATHLLGPAATYEAVLKALPGHSWLHLSCHGIQDPADAALSAFLLHDQPLTLADLAALNLRETDLAYLAACQTATGDLRLLDEALHLAGALQLIGYRHVLATLWSIADAAAPAMADITYAHLLHPDPGQPRPADRAEAARAPFALYHAVTRLRQAAPGEPLLWAPYIHLGP